jgi:hypothetical protein
MGFVVKVTPDAGRRVEKARGVGMEGAEGPRVFLQSVLKLYSLTLPAKKFENTKRRAEGPNSYRSEARFLLSIFHLYFFTIPFGTRYFPISNQRKCLVNFLYVGKIGVSVWEKITFCLGKNTGQLGKNSIASAINLTPSPSAAAGAVDAR